jgi:hypothetical protein
MRGQCNHTWQCGEVVCGWSDLAYLALITAVAFVCIMCSLLWWAGVLGGSAQLSGDASLAEQMEATHAELRTFLWFAPWRDDGRPWWRYRVIRQCTRYAFSHYRVKELQRRIDAFERLANERATSKATSHRYPRERGRGWPSTRRVVHAIVYHGAYYRTPFGLDGNETHAGFLKCSDYLQARANHEKQLLGPLRTTAKKVYIFLHTYTSGYAERDNELIKMLRPKRWSIERQARHHSSVHSYLSGLYLLRDSRVAVDWVTVTRFDTVYRVPYLALHLDWERLNIAWRSEAWAWLESRTTSDLFVALPTRFVEAYADALVRSGKSHKLGKLHGFAHWVYEPLAKDSRVGEGNVSFVEEGYFQSKQDVLTVKGRPMNDLFVAILRACPAAAQPPAPESRAPMKPGGGVRWLGSHSQHSGSKP